MNIYKEAIRAIYQLIMRTCTDRIVLVLKMLIDQDHVRADLTSPSSSPMNSPPLQPVHLPFLNAQVHLKLYKYG